MPKHYEAATLQAIDIVKSYCGTNEQLKAIFGRGRGKSTIYQEHPELAAQLSFFDSNTIRNCFLAIKQSMNTDTMMVDAKGPSNKAGHSSSPYHVPSSRTFHHRSPMYDSEEMAREETALEKMVQEARNFTLDKVTLRTGDETIAAAKPGVGLILVDPAQMLFDDRCEQAATNCDFDFVGQMQREKVSS